MQSETLKLVTYMLLRQLLTCYFANMSLRPKDVLEETNSNMSLGHCLDSKTIYIFLFFYLNHVLFETVYTLMSFYYNNFNLTPKNIHFLFFYRFFFAVFAFESNRLSSVQSNNKTNYCSYVRPAQSGPIRRLGPLRSDSVNTYELSLFRSFSVNVLPSRFRNADQWKSDYRVVTNEKPRN